MSPFAGFDMPIQYSSITEEHNAVREHCGVFDVSHMGESYVEGPDAERFVNNIFTNDVTNAPLGQVYYGMMCHPNGGTVDICLYIRWAKRSSSSFTMLVISTKMWHGLMLIRKVSI